MMLCHLHIYIISLLCVCARAYVFFSEISDQLSRWLF